MVGWGEIEILIPASNSLKSKRHVLAPILVKLKQAYNVSVCEVEGQNTWQRATLQLAIVGTSSDIILQAFDSILKTLEENPEIALIRQDFQVI
ncbi:MAG: DUF503 domain-containing protein [Coprothermobacterota bacterium]|jgi:uncharacterized protein YlxP (DUF503 family)|nr:DUF503 domain-containing protein [Caldisericota bacterium]MDI6868467.1 DUF503 domain-containing protein [Coprothermobacterota bacterium]